MNGKASHPQAKRRAEAAPSIGSLTDGLEWTTRNGHDVDQWRGEPLLLRGGRFEGKATIDDILSIFPHQQRGLVKKCVAACLRGGAPAETDLTIAAGPLEGAPMRFTVERHEENDAPLLRCALRLATPQAEATRRMIADAFSGSGVDNILLDKLLDTVPNAIAVYDDEDRLIYFNRQYRRLYERAAPAIRIGERYEKILRYAVEHGQYADLDPADRKLCEFWIEKRLEMRRTGMIGALVQKLASGRWVQVHENKMQNGHTVFICTDITDLKKTETLIRRQAESDSLTGLLNRPTFFAACRSRLRRRRRDDAVSCLILIDLDMFKSINDTMGHHAGDVMLRAIAERIGATLREDDLSARLGGDEFAAFVTTGTAEEAEAVVRKLHAALTERLTLSGRIMYPHLSIGYVTTRREEDIDALYHKADAALSEAKSRGRNTWRNYDRDMQKRQERENYIVQSLRESLADEAFHFQLQPQLSLDDGRHVGFEVLARWRHDSESIPPTEFIPVAENAGLIMEISRRVFIKAFEWFARMREMEVETGYLALNISAQQLKCPTFMDCIEGLMHEFSLRPTDLELEITETAIIGRDERLIGDTLGQLADMGLRITLDDFGTGNATLAHLKRFPISALKIDKSFVREIGRNAENTIITRAIINLAQNLGIDVVAEGVETEEQLSFLRINGCDLVQGHLISAPLAAQAAEEWLLKRRSM